MSATQDGGGGRGRPFRAVALVAAYNEGDVIAQVIADLVRQRVEVYLLDHGSTDDTRARAEPFLGRGLIAIERFPGDGPIPAGEVAAHPWRSVLRRKEQLARELDADWFLHHDADELRESPWEHLDLAAALERVDGWGYDAVDFEVFEFVPTDDRFQPGDDLRAAFAAYRPAAAYDRLQIKAWRKTASLDLVSSGGHEAVFRGRRVFPVRFLLRHYPFRGQAHGERKVFAERRPRLVAAEGEREGWHRQYDAIAPGHRFVVDAGTLLPFDPVRARLRLFLEHREAGGRPPESDELVSCRRQLALVERELDTSLHRLAAAEGRLAEVAARLEAVVASKSWRWTAPVRRLLVRLGLGG